MYHKLEDYIYKTMINHLGQYWISWWTNDAKSKIVNDSGPNGLSELHPTALHPKTILFLSKKVLD